MNTITLNSGPVCWHDRATKTIGPTTHQINWYCPDCGYTRTTYPTPGDSVDAPVQQAALQEAARETIKWLNSYFRFHDGNKYADKLSAALKGEQPAQPSGSERGNGS